MWQLLFQRRQVGNMKKLKTEVENRNQKMELRRLAAYGQKFMERNAQKQQMKEGK